MISEETSHLLMLGPPASGKSTFLATVWHLLTSEEIPTALALTRVEGDREYIDDLAAAWRRCERVERNKVGDPQPVALHLTDGSQSVVLHLPDMSGEILVQAAAHRSWPATLEETVRKASGLLLFVGPEGLNEPDSLDEAIQQGRLLGGSAQARETPAAHKGAGGQTSQTAVGGGEPFTTAEMPTQSLLVDAVQEIVHLQDREPAIAVVVSAWDLVRSTKSPRVWIRRRLPLLYQYLESGPFAWEGIGLSAQGGRLPEEAAELRSLDVPAERIRVVIGPHRTHDVTEIVGRLRDRIRSRGR